MRTIILSLSAMLAVFTMMLAPAEAAKKHVKTDNQECGECHTAEAAVWNEGKHGLMSVKCVVCHGSPDEKGFVAHPGIKQCKSCHFDKVESVEAKLPPKERNCFKCHKTHVMAPKDEAVENKHGFHEQGGPGK